jgi:hypothetical protein
MRCLPTLLVHDSLPFNSKRRCARASPVFPFLTGLLVPISSPLYFRAGMRLCVMCKFDDKQYGSAH